jgi:hypothetical protein
MGLLLLNKNSICIDSTVVEKIDRVGTLNSNVATIYNCKARRSADYSVSSEQLVQKVENSIQKTVLVLNSIKPFTKNIEIKVYEDQLYRFEVVSNKIGIGRNYLNLKQHLSRALVKAWLNENRSDTQINTQVYNESLADLILFIIDGKVELEDPLDKVRTKIGSAKWPQVIKNVLGYCTSSWKYSEHTESCYRSQNTKLSLNSSESNELQVATFSLRPLLTSALISAYSNMSFNQQQRFSYLIPQLISGFRLNSEQIVESLLVDKNPLRNGIVNINKFTNLLLSADRGNKTEIYQLYTSLTQYLQQAGVTDTFAEAQFDFMVEYNGQLNTRSSFYKKLEMAAYKNPQVQIALKDSQHIWILPSKTALPISLFNKLYSRQLFHVSCAKSEIRLADYFQKAEKMMLISYCDKSLEIKFDSLFSKGVKSFIALNPKFNFVQLHLPSLELIKDDIESHPDFFKLVKNKDIYKNEFKKLGWSNVQWNSEIKAYQPRAVIDAIEYYRN